MKILSSLFLLSLLFSIGNTASCSQNGPNPNDLIEAGKLTISKKSQTRHQCYTFSLQYNVPQTGFDIILSVNDFNSFNIQNGLEFILRGGKGNSTNSALIVVTTSNNQFWSSIQITYFATSRADIFIGSLNIETLYFLGCSDQNSNDTSITSVPIRNLPYLSGQNYNILVFLSGIRAQNNNFGISITKKQLNSQNNLLTIQIQKVKTSIIQTIIVSYIIYANIPFQAYLSQTTQNLNSYDYFFSGIQKINFNGQSKGILNSAFALKSSQSQNNLLQCQGKLCKKQCLSPIQCYQTGGQIISNKCINCQPAEYYQDGKCLANCGQFQSRSTRTGECICYPQYQKYQGRCYPICRTNAVWINSVCTCLEGYTQFGQNCFKAPECKQNQTFIQGKCQCKPGYISFNNSCIQIPKCQSNQYLSGLTCVCVFGYQKKNGKCSPVQKCDSNQQFVNNKCVCKNGYRLVRGKCQKIPGFCEQNQYFNGRQCACLSGYSKIAGNCILVNRCNQNQIFVNNQCQCKGGFAQINGKCLQIPKCGANQQLNGVRCICINGYQKFNNNICQKIVTCKINQIRTTQNKCQCRNGYKYNSNGVCQQISICKINQQYQQSTNKCVCKQGYVFLEGICKQIPKCDIQSQYLDKINNKCLCQRDFTEINNKCVKIDTLCKENQQFSQKDNGCICKANYIKQNGKCVQIPCGANQVRVNNVCTCVSGYAKLGPFCAPICGINQQYLLNSCSCKQGYDKINGVCRKCPQNSKPNSNSTACSCNNGYAFDSSQTNCLIVCGQKEIKKVINGKQVCQCNQGYARDNSGKCILINSISCPNRSIFNQQKLVCQCADPEQHLINQKCQKCGQNQGWNTQKCVCLTGFFLIQDKCKPCPEGTVYNGNKCVCNIRYYLDGASKCNKCHSSCLQCKGPNSNDCLICSDIKLKLQSDGTCSQNGNCAPNQYYLETGCRQCSSYCSQCQDQNKCKTCISGFQLKDIELGGAKGQFCFEICGDGKKFELECDDGNLLNGDGCSDKCEVQPGYTCVGGSSTRPSTCQNTTDVRSIITPKKGVLLFGRVLYGLYMNNIPAALRKNNCQQCSKLISVKVVQSTLVPEVKIQYITKSQYQFLVEFNFFGLLAIPPFAFTAQISQKFKDYFSKQDLQQLQIVKVDPALLAKFDENQSLTLQDLAPKGEINAPQKAIDASLR